MSTKTDQDYFDAANRIRSAINIFACNNKLDLSLLLAAVSYRQAQNAMLNPPVVRGLVPAEPIFPYWITEVVKNLALRGIGSADMAISMDFYTEDYQSHNSRRRLVESGLIACTQIGGPKRYYLNEAGQKWAEENFDPKQADVKKLPAPKETPEYMTATEFFKSNNLHVSHSEFQRVTLSARKQCAAMGLKFIRSESNSQAPNKYPKAALYVAWNLLTREKLAPEAAAVAVKPTVSAGIAAIDDFFN